MEGCNKWFYLALVVVCIFEIYADIYFTNQQYKERSVFWTIVRILMNAVVLCVMGKLVQHGLIYYFG